MVEYLIQMWVNVYLTLPLDHKTWVIKTLKYINSCQNRHLLFPVLVMAVRTLVATEFAITRSFHTSTTVFIPYLMQQHPCQFWSYQCNQLGQWQHWATQDLWISNKNQEGHRKVWGSIRQRFHSPVFSLFHAMIRFKKLFSISLLSQKMHHLF